MDQQERDYLVAETEAALQEAMSNLFQIKTRFDRLGDQARYTAIAMTELEKTHAIVVAFLAMTDDNHAEDEGEDDE